MDLTGKKVKHKTFGTGTIVKADEQGRITVEFGTKTSSFQYPLAFESYLEAEDRDLQDAIMAELQLKKDAIEEEKVAKRARLAEAVQWIYGSSEYVEKKYVPVKRVEGKALTFFVFQGGIYDIQSKEQYIWAPVYSASGDNMFYWDSIMNVHEGDVILHGDGGYVKAVSRAKGQWYQFDNPYDIFDNPIYKDGRRVDCEYTIFNTPILTSDFRDDIIRYCSVKYAPFDKNGNGNRGYLYDIDMNLASVFIKAAAENNPELNNLEYIHWLL